MLSLGAASLWGQLPAPGGVSPEVGLATWASAARQLGAHLCALHSAAVARASGRWLGGGIGAAAVPLSLTRVIPAWASGGAAQDCASV